MNEFLLPISKANDPVILPNHLFSMTINGIKTINQSHYKPNKNDKSTDTL